MKKIALLGVWFSGIVLNLCVAYAAPGDVDGDGKAGLADALKIIRHMDGVEILTPAQQGLADVHPLDNPDGNIDADDVKTILGIVTGTIAAPEVTGQLEWEAPVITSLSPTHGVVGAEVTITGRNFPSQGNAASVILVTFGDSTVQAAVVADSATRLRATVPEGAESGPIRILTPGGMAVSPITFTVTGMLDGTFTPDGGLSADGYEIVTPFGVNAVGADGSFQVAGTLSGPGIVGAVPKTRGGGTYLQVFNGHGTRGASPTINATSTAIALIFLHPFLMTDDSTKTDMILGILENNSAVAELASVISARYPAGADGLDDPEVKAAWENAVLSVFQEMPDNRTIGAARRSAVSATPAASAGAKRATFTTKSGKKIRILRMDPNYFELAFSEEDKAVIPSLSKEYSPVDWLLTITRLDPDALPNGLGGGYPGEEFKDLKKRDIRKLGNYEKTCLIAAIQWTAKIDVWGEGVGFVMDGMFDFVGLGGEDEGLPLASVKEDGLYIIRAYSGSWKDCLKWTGDDADAIKNIDGAPRYARNALCINVVLALMDAWSLVAGDEKGFKEESIKAAMQAALAESAKELGGKPLSDFNEKGALKSILNVTMAAGEAMVSHAGETGMDMAKEQLLKTCAKTLTGAGALLESLSKISTLGRIGERVAGEMGYLINVYGMELTPGPSPMESSFVVVGDPFAPVLDSVTPDSAISGQSLEISGSHFMEDPVENTVRLGNCNCTVVAATTSKLTVTIPVDMSTGDYALSVSTKRSLAPVYYESNIQVLALPVVTEIMPTSGYGFSDGSSLNPYHGLSRRLTVQGTNMQSADTTGRWVYINSVDVSSGATWNDTSVYFNCPALPADQDVTVLVTYEYDGRRYSAGERTFHVYSSPTITGVNVTDVTTGSVFSITGTNLGESKCYLEEAQLNWRTTPTVDQQTRRTVQGVNDQGLNDGAAVTLTIWNPAGKAMHSLTWRTGIEATPPDAFPKGADYQVDGTGTGMNPDGVLTVDEALASARGELNLWGGGYDDTDREVVYHYKGQPKINDPYTYEFVYLNKSEKDLQTNSAGEESIFIYCEVHYIDDTPDERGLSGTISLDSGDGDYSFLADELQGDPPYGEEQAFVREEGDKVIDDGIEKGCGANFADTIQCYGTEPYNVTALNLGPQDTLDCPYRTLNAGSGTLEEKSTLRCGNLNLASRLNTKNFCLVQASFSGLGLVGNETHGATFKLQASNAKGILLALEASTGNTIVLEGDLKTTESILELKNCKYNTVSAFSLHTLSCSGTALTIDGGEGNRFQSPFKIDGANKGMVLKNTTNLQFSGITIEDCGIWAVQIENSEMCLLSGLEVYDCDGAGVLLDNSRLCEIGGASFAGLGGACVRIANNSSNNIIYHMTIGLRDDAEADTAAGGIVIDSGAKNNLLNNVKIANCAADGVCISGNGTDGNRLLGCDIGYFSYSNVGDTASLGNGGAGVVIENGASENRIEGGSVCSNTDGGVIIRDVGTDGNQITACRVGAVTYNYEEDGRYHYSAVNGKWGIHISQGAAGTLIQDCEVGIHPLGGIYVGPGESRTATRAAADVTIKDTSIGYSSWYHSPNSAEPADSSTSPTSGWALLLDRVESVSLTTVETYGFAGGVKIIGGQDSQGWAMKDIYIRCYDGQGLYAENLSNTTLDSVRASSCGAAGITFSQCSNITFNSEYKAITQSANRTAGMVFEDCTGVSLFASPAHDFTIWNTQRGNSLHFKNCSDIDIHGLLFNGTYSEEDDGDTGHCIVLDNCSDVEISSIEASTDFDCCGKILVVNSCDKVTLTGTMDQPSRIKNFREGGIYIDNSTAVTIGGESHEPLCVFGEFGEYQTDPAIEIRNCASQGMDEEPNITISSCRFDFNLSGTDSTPLVLIEDSTDVLFGHLSQFFSNQFFCEARKRNGVEVSGGGDKVNILNNSFRTDEIDPLLGKFITTLKHDVALKGCAGVVVSGNYMEHTFGDSITLEDGASGNLIAGNRMENTFGSGIWATGATSNQNTFSQNIVVNSTSSSVPIRLNSGANDNALSPTIDGMSTDGRWLHGIVPFETPDGSRVEVYGGYAGDASMLLGHAPVFNGEFSLSTYVPSGMEVGALVIHPNGNTSQIGMTVLPPVQPSFLYANTSGDNLDIWVQARDSAPARLTVNPAADSEPTIIGKNKGIVFVSDRSGNKDLWLTLFADATPVQLTTNPAADYSPAGHYDTIVFVSERDDGRPHIYKYNQSSNSVTALTSGNHSNNFPSWDVNCDKIVFASDRDGTWDIWVMNSDGSGPSKWYASNANETQPTWSYFSTITFCSDADGSQNLYECNENGAALLQKTLNDDGVTNRYPSGDTMNDNLLFTSDRSHGTNGIYWYRRPWMAKQLLVSSVALGQPCILANSYARLVTDTFIESWRSHDNPTRRTVATTRQASTLEVTCVTGTAGQSATPAVNVSDTMPAAMSLEISYDSTALTPRDERGDSYAAGNAICVRDASSGTIRLAWVGRAGESYPDPFLELPFDIDPDILSGHSPISITAAETLDQAGATLSPFVLDGGIDIIAVDPLADISDMASAAYAYRLTLASLVAAGATGALEENLADYIDYIQKAGIVPSSAFLQKMIDYANQGITPIAVSVANGWNMLGSVFNNWVPASGFLPEEMLANVWDWNSSLLNYTEHSRQEAVSSFDGRWVYLRALPEAGTTTLALGDEAIQRDASEAFSPGWNLTCISQTQPVSEINLAGGNVTVVWHWNCDEQGYEHVAAEDNVYEGHSYWLYIVEAR